MHKRPQTADKSPVCSRSWGTSQCTPTSRSPWPNEDSRTCLLIDSPGPDGLGSMSLSTPKRKSKMFGEDVTSHSKVKLTIFAEVNTILKTSQQSIIVCNSVPVQIFHFVLYFIRECHQTICLSKLNSLELSK